MDEKYQKIFLEEAAEHLQAMNKALLELEKAPAKLEAVQEIFRASHTLKSMAAAMGCLKTEQLCHALEDVLELIKKKAIPPSAEIIDLLFTCCDGVKQLIQEVKTGQEKTDIASWLQQLKEISIQKKSLQKKSARKVTEKKSKEETPPSEFMTPEAIPKIESVKVNVERLDTLLNLTEELLVTRLHLNQIKARLDNEELAQALAYFERVSNDLQFHVLQARMMPVGLVFERFPRMVRDLAKTEKKEVSLVLEGGDIELDRTIIDSIGEPLVHLIRNAIGHGLTEKVPGIITLAAKREKGSVLIVIQDNGKGLDYAKIKQKALERKIIAPESNPTTEELGNLLFEHPLSTAEKATLISGRGVGLAVVKKGIEGLGGTVRIESAPHQGTRVTLRVPLTLAIIKALLTKIGAETYALPLFDIIRSVKVNTKTITQVKAQESIVVGKETVRLIRLHNLFNLREEPDEESAEEPGAGKEREEGKKIEARQEREREKKEREKEREKRKAGEEILVVLVKKEQTLAGLIVDELVNETEIIVKPLSKLLRESRNFSGSTILGDGSVALILDVGNIIGSIEMKKSLGGIAHAQ